MIRKNIPNFFTLCNLLCGCIAIVFAFEGNLVGSAYMVGIACVFDFLDGLIARVLNVHSEIGKQLDSLADMVSFGVVPGVIMYFWLRGDHLYNNPLNDIPIFFLLPLLGFLITIFSAIRLAKFNLDARQSDSFIGLPTPANAIFIAFLPFLLNYFQEKFFLNIFLSPLFIIVLTLLSSFLLIFPLPLFALKFKNFSWKDNSIRYIFLVLSLALLIIFRFAGIPLIIVLYIILSIANNLIRKKTAANYKW